MFGLTQPPQAAHPSQQQHTQPPSLYLSAAPAAPPGSVADLYQPLFRSFAPQIAPQPAAPPAPSTIMVSSTNSLMTASIKPPPPQAHAQGATYRECFRTLM